MKYTEWCNMVFRYAGHMMHQRGNASQTRYQLTLLSKKLRYF